MSGTIKQTFQMSVGNGGFADAVTINNLEVVQNNIGASSGVRTIGFAADEVIDTGDLATEGYVFIKNLEETGGNFITWGPDAVIPGTMVGCGEVKPGEFAWFRLKSGIVFRAQADTADVQADIRIYED